MTFIYLLVCVQVKLSEKTSLLEAAESKAEELTAKVNEQQRLIQKLEDDILKVCSAFSDSSEHLFMLHSSYIM